MEPRDPTYQPPQGATLNEYGYWILPSGDFAPGQDMSGQMAGATDAQKAQVPGPLLWDPVKHLSYRVISGERWYGPPAYDPARGTGSGPSDPGGGLIHGRAQWNPKTGQYDTPLDWGKILSMVTAGIITAGAADALLSSTPALAATAPPGASAATSAPTLEGLAAGGGGATTIPAGAAPVVGGSTIPAATYGADGVVSSFSSVAPEAGGGSVAGLSYGDLLKYGLPVAGNLVNGLIQAKASGAATDAQQKYLEEALAYQKESDLFNRNRQAGLDAQEVQRYGAYQGRILPFIQNGTSSNDRMAALLGLPPRANGSNGGSSGPSPSQRVPYDAATSAKIRAELQAVNSNDDPAAWDEYLASHGDSADKNWAYWKNRIDTGDGVGRGYAGASTPPVSPAAAGMAITSKPITTQPVLMRAPDGSTQSVDPAHVDHYTGLGATPVAATTSAAPVQMRGPDGSVKTVPADQVDHYKQLGATLLGAAA